MQPNINLQLHIFVDASEEAYAAVAYWSIDYLGKVSIVFVMGKANCSPLKTLFVPRLKLQAAVMRSRIKEGILSSHNVVPSIINFWSDSKTVINWIQSDRRRYKQYVAHRVSEILENTKVAEWKWVPGTMNPADAATRMSCHGPSFLCREPFELPKQPDDLKEHYGTDERRLKFVGQIMMDTLSNMMEKFSSYEKLMLFFLLGATCSQCL